VELSVVWPAHVEEVAHAGRAVVFVVDDVMAVETNGVGATGDFAGSVPAKV
jgi:hypothetical protein